MLEVQLEHHLLGREEVMTLVAYSLVFAYPIVLVLLPRRVLLEKLEERLLMGLLFDDLDAAL